MDSVLRRLERQGWSEAYWAAVRRADLFHDYGCVIGPVAMWDHVCADPGCYRVGLAYSDCSWCLECHNDSHCVPIIQAHEGRWHEYVVQIDGRLELSVEEQVSCNLMWVEDGLKAP